jgi:hypothetical protein
VLLESAILLGTERQRRPDFVVAIVLVLVLVVIGRVVVTHAFVTAMATKERMTLKVMTTRTELCCLIIIECSVCRESIELNESFKLIMPTIVVWLSGSSTVQCSTSTLLVDKQGEED